MPEGVCAVCNPLISLAMLTATWAVFHCAGSPYTSVTLLLSPTLRRVLNTPVVECTCSQRSRLAYNGDLGLR